MDLSIDDYVDMALRQLVLQHRVPFALVPPKSVSAGRGEAVASKLRY